MVMNEDIQKGYFMVHLFFHGETYVRVPSVDGISAPARLQTASILTEFHKNPFITCGGETKAMGTVLGFQCETFNDVRRFRNSSPCSERKLNSS